MILQFNLHSSSMLLAAVMLGTVSGVSAETTSVDMCVYGGTSGAIAAAVQAKRMSKSVVVVSPDRFLGGMTSGGLCYTDIGDERILGGLSLEFFNSIYDHYQRSIEAGQKIDFSSSAHLKKGGAFGGYGCLHHGFPPRPTLCHGKG